MKKKLLFLGAVLVATGLLIGAYFLFVQPKKLGTGEKTVTLEIVTKGRKPPVAYQVNTDCDTLYDLLSDLAARGDIEKVEYNDYGIYGLFVSGMHGSYNVADEQMYFAIYINGEYASDGCKEILLSDGDTILFKLTSYTEDPDNSGASNLWIFLEIAGLLGCMGLMAYMIVKDNER